MVSSLALPVSDCGSLMLSLAFFIAWAGLGAALLEIVRTWPRLDDANPGFTAAGLFIFLIGLSHIMEYHP